MFKLLPDIGFNVRPDTDVPGFNMRPDTGVPGFRLGLPEDQPAFAIDNNDSMRAGN